MNKSQIGIQIDIIFADKIFKLNISLYEKFFTIMFDFHYGENF
jgi:hypothetical protein